MTPGVCMPLLGSLGGPLTPHRSHARHSRHRIRPLGRGAMSAIRWCAHHLLQLGPPWGTGAMPPHPGDGGALLGHLRGPKTPHNNHIRRCRHIVSEGSNGSGGRTVVCTPSSAARVAMGHWRQCPHIPGMVGHCLVTFGGQRLPTTTTFGVADTSYPRVQTVWVVVRWCAHHLQQLGLPWGIGGNAPTSQGW
jgi:hypothetical protein